MTQLGACSCSVAISNHYKFTGKERDETGDDNFGARYYNSQKGRFLTPDWSAVPSAVPYAVLSSPQSLNLYSYVQNNPITGIDPDGHMTVREYYGDRTPDWASSPGPGLAGMEGYDNGAQYGLGVVEPVEASARPRAQNQGNPAGLVAVKVEVMDTGNAYGIKLKVTYQIVDQKGNAVTGSGMEPQERVSAQVNGQPLQMSIGTGWGDIGPSTVKGTSKYADAKGQFVDAPLGITGQGRFMSVSNQEIRIKMGKETFPVRYNRIVITSESPGHGKFSNQAGGVGGDLNAEH